MKHYAFTSISIISRLSFTAAFRHTIHFNLDVSARHPMAWTSIGSPANNPVLAEPHLSLHSEINTLHDRALDLACITKNLLDDAAGPLLAQLSPAGHLIQQESWQGQERELAKYLVFHLNSSIIIS